MKRLFPKKMSFRYCFIFPTSKSQEWANFFSNIHPHSLIAYFYKQCHVEEPILLIYRQEYVHVRKTFLFSLDQFNLIMVTSTQSEKIFNIWLTLKCLKSETHFFRFSPLQPSLQHLFFSSCYSFWNRSLINSVCNISK